MPCFDSNCKFLTNIGYLHLLLSVKVSFPFSFIYLILGSYCVLSVVYTVLLQYIYNYLILQTNEPTTNELQISLTKKM